jgi:tetratricopeptide (TPR) repeat protein
MAEEALQLFKSLDEPWWVGLTLNHLSIHSFYINDEPKQKMYIEESLTVRRKLGDSIGIAISLKDLSWDVSREEADEMMFEALAICTELDDLFQIVNTYGDMGLQWIRQGRFCEARTLYHEILEAYSDLDFTQSYASMIHAHLGYPDLHLGRYDSARKLARDAVEFLKEVKYHMAGLHAAVAAEILGEVDLAEGAFGEAQSRFQECLIIFQNYAHPERIRKAMAGLGYANRGLNQISRSRENFCQALRVAIDNQSLVHTLPGIALLFADQGEVEKAVELYALASTYDIVANSKWFDDIAGDEIAAMAEGLPVEVAEAAKARGRNLDLWNTAKALLTELEELGWGDADQKIDFTSTDA